MALKYVITNETLTHDSVLNKTLYFEFSRFAFKVVIGSTAIYYTRELEIWEPLSHEERAYDKAFAEAKKFINENKPASLNLEVI